MEERYRFISKENINDLIEKLASSLGDEVELGLKSMEIEEKHSVSRNYLKWDLFNKNCIKAFSEGTLIARYARRGPWHMVPLVDFSSNFIFSVMREARFKELSRGKSRRKKAHYMEAFAQSFNFDLGESSQMSIFLEKQFGEEEVAKIVNDILNDMNVEREAIQNYAVILFNEFNHELISIKCCVINSELEIIEEEDWSSYIKHRESVIPEVVEAEESSQYKQSVSLKPKARERAKQKQAVDKKRKKQEQKTENGR